jgi:hypothetical protein
MEMRAPDSYSLTFIAFAASHTPNRQTRVLQLPTRKWWYISLLEDFYTRPSSRLKSSHVSIAVKLRQLPHIGIFEPFCQNSALPLADIDTLTTAMFRSPHEEWRSIQVEMRT